MLLSCEESLVFGLIMPRDHLKMFSPNAIDIQPKRLSRYVQDQHQAKILDIKLKLPD